MIVSQTALTQRLALITRVQVERAVQLADWSPVEVGTLLGPGFYERIPDVVDGGAWLRSELQRTDWTSSPWFARIIEDTVRGSKKYAVVISVGCEGLEDLIEGADPIDTTILLTELGSTMRDIVESFAGFFERIVGSSVIAVFGAPASHRTDTLNAFLAARGIQRNIAQSTMLSDLDISSLKVKIGVECGTLWAGCLRVPHDPTLLDYTVIGRPVSVAIKIQEEARQGEILAGEEFCEKIAKTGLAKSGKPRTIQMEQSTIECYPLHPTGKLHEERQPPLVPSERADTFDYQQGIERMKQVIKQVNPPKETWLELVSLESQLLENLDTTLTLSPTQELRHDRNRIVRELNSLADQLRPGMSFTDLCKG
jgi:class 3 adenylate cyclase